MLLLRRLLVAVAAGVLLAPSAAAAAAVPPLAAGDRVVDVTGRSLSTSQEEDLEARLTALEAETGADAVVVVRELAATPEETLEQVEEMQQAWVVETGAAPGAAVAVLVNRQPGDDTDARAGIFVGETLQEGGVPTGEQVALVEDELVPALREGDVAGGLVATVERLSTSVQEGPPRSAFQVWSAGAGGTWVPWAGALLALAGGPLVLLLHRRRAHVRTGEPVPTTRRPGDLPAALVGALVAGSPQPSAVPAVVLDLAARGAVALEPGVAAEPDGADDAEDERAQLRLLDEGLVRDDVERAVWEVLLDHAEDGVVGPDELPTALADSGTTREVVQERLGREGWWDRSSQASRRAMAVVAGVAGVLALGAGLVGVAGEEVLVLAAVVPLVALSVLALVLLGSFSRLTAAGQEAAVPWRGYRAGLERAGDDDAPPELLAGLDLDASLPDVVALGLEDALEDRLDEAARAGELRALAMTSTAPGAAPPFGSWAVFAAVLASTTPTSSTTTVTTTTSSGGGAAAST
ncbi:DUF2207 family protein [Pseudokineococcus sp. 1T1Z-3]|uniref:DUF2207 family protein n=1 Tax=Pseudokineococcus sp. 1T1Z-3 TaxID=3132745 RepID=UPI0030AE5814